MARSRIHSVAAFAVLLFGAPAFAQDAPTTSAEVTRLVAKFGERMVKSRYMERDCTPTTYPGWEGFPLSRCRYSVVDTDGTTKTADVIMLNPSPEQVARWVVNAVADTTATLRPEVCDKLFSHIIGQSGGQYPVAGVVYEDIIPADGKFEIYCFRNGVTVAAEGVPHRGTDPMTPAQAAASLFGRVTSVYRYARIQSTSPEEYTANGGRRRVGTNQQRTPEWLEASRECYQASWHSDRSEMMTAWARANLQ